MAEPQRAMDKFRGEDMAMPEVKLVQNVGGGFAKDKGARPGDFFIGLTDEVIKGTEGFDIVVIDMTKTRTYWGRAEISDEPPECASLDADSLVSIQNTSCKECPYREDLAWRLSASERRGKCNISYNTLAIVPTDEKRDTNLPVLIRASGISTKPIKELFTQLRLNPKLRTKDGQSLIHKALIHVTSERKKTVSGEAWCYHFRLKSVIPDGDQAEELKAQTIQLIRTTFIGLPEGRSEEESQQADQAIAQGPPPPGTGTGTLPAKPVAPDLGF